MRIKFTQSVAGPEYAYAADQEVDVPIDQAEQFVRARVAVLLDAEPPVEVAAVVAPERAVSKRGGRKSRVGA